MAEKEQDIVCGWLFDGPNTAHNVKFFRGSRDMISVDEFWRELHSAFMQKRLGAAEVSDAPPISDRKIIDVREFVATL